MFESNMNKVKFLIYPGWHFVYIFVGFCAGPVSGIQPVSMVTIVFAKGSSSYGNANGLVPGPCVYHQSSALTTELLLHLIAYTDYSIISVLFDIQTHWALGAIK